MPKTLEDALTALEGLENGNELVAAVTGRINTVNNEARNLRERAKKAEEKFSKIVDLSGIDGSAEDIETEFKTKVLKGTAPNAEMQKLTKQVEQLISERDNAVSEKRKLTLTNKINSILDETKVLPGVKQSLLNLLSASTKFDETANDFRYIDNGNEVDLVEGIKGFVKVNPQFVHVDQRPGAGGNGGNGGGQKEMLKSDFLKLEPKERAAKMAEGYTLKD